MLLPHEACTLRPVTFCVMSVFLVTSIHRVTAGAATGCLMRELYSMDCVTTAWLMVLSHKGSLILHCVTVAAATPSLHTQSCKRFLPGVGVWTAWRLRDWCCCAYCLYWSDCVTDAAVTCTEAHEWGKPGELYRLPDERVVQYGLRDDCVTDGGAVSQWQPDSTLRDCCCCHTKLAHSVLKTVSAWYLLQCVTTAWLMLRPHRGCQAVSCCVLLIVCTVWWLRDWCCCCHTVAAGRFPAVYC